MPREVILPRVDMDMAEGRIALWHVADGDAVRKGQPLFEIETDKATMEVEAEAEGVVRLVHTTLGEALPVGEVVAWILRPGETLPGAPPREAPVPPAEGAVPAPATDAARVTAAAPAAPDTPVPAADVAPAPLLRATPLARSLARQHGIALGDLRGSGENGRILARDLGLPEGTGAGAAKGSPMAPTPLHLQWFTRGTGVPLLLLHGFGADLGSWRPLLAHLRGVPALGIDLPNHGRSPASAIDGFDSLAQALLRRIDDEGIGSLHLAGHSLGGGAAVALSGLLGPRLRSLTLVAPAGFGPGIHGDFLQGLLRAQGEASLRPWLAQLFGDGHPPSGSFTATALQQLGDTAQRAALARMASAFFPDGTQAISLRDRLAALPGLPTLPVSVVWGLADAIAPAHQRLGLPGAVAVHGLPGVGHLPQVEEAPLVAALLRRQMAAASAHDPGGATRLSDRTLANAPAVAGDAPAAPLAPTAAALS